MSGSRASWLGTYLPLEALLVCRGLTYPCSYYLSFMMLQWLLMLVFIDFISADSLVEPLQGCGARLRETEAGQSALAQILESRVEASVAADLKRAVTEHGVLVIPGASSLSPAAHVVFTSLFGVPGTHPRRGKPPGLPCLEGMDCLVEVASTNSSSVYFSEQTKAGMYHCPSAVPTYAPPRPSL